MSRCRTIAAGLLACGTFALPAADSAAVKQTFGSRALALGMHGRDVRVLQDFLTRAGLKTAVDGSYGRGTARTVRSWERRSGRHVDGRMSRSDATALRGAVDSSAPAEPQSLAAPADKAVVGAGGLATAPDSAPPEVKAIIDAGNRIATKPYKYGGGHGNWEDSGYDCSGSMSYAFHGAGLLDEALDSSGFMSWGDAGKGQWVTTYAKASHSFMDVAGLRFDTSGRASDGTRWHSDKRSTAGYTVRHPTGL